jgi:hypothetical protein
MKAGEKSKLYIPAAHADSGADEEIEIELLDFLNVYDLRGDCMILKKILRKGFGYERCSFKDEITLSLKLTQNDQTLFEQDSMIYVMNDEKELLYEILKSMKIREEAEATVEFAHYAETHHPLVD